ncbi:MAG TPA: TetR family transcriptional regulator C-terminal domain-containing protein [Microbacteriaceae bacterium]|nr:TetR family transcriptional regulator C-terminal domain-containing protein [Microbacteriaceae bacterium]
MPMSPQTTRPRVRLSAEERGLAIVDAACAIAREHGLSAITLRAIAGRLDVASGLITHYEPSMDGLIARVFRQIVSAELLELQEEVARFRSASERMRALIVTLLGGGRESVTVVWIEAYALGRRNVALRKAVQAESRAWSRFVVELIQAGVAEGVFHVADPAATAWQLIGMIDGLNAQALVRESDALAYVAQMARASETLLGATSGSLAG